MVSITKNLDEIFSLSIGFSALIDTEQNPAHVMNLLQLPIACLKNIKKDREKQWPYMLQVASTCCKTGYRFIRNVR